MKTLIRAALVLGSLLCVAVLVSAQSRNTGEIRGTVTDSSGAAIAGATVTLSNIDTGEMKEFVTNADGIYDTVSTPAGNYNLAFAAKGFSRLVRGPVTLQVDVITQDAKLQVGQITETVTVTAEGLPLLETETAHLGAVLGGEDHRQSAADWRRNHRQRLGELQHSATRRCRVSDRARV